MLRRIKEVSQIFLEKVKERNLYIISHNDTDGITSAAIITKALKNLDISFELKIVKGLEEEMIYNLPEDKLILFLDLASGSLDYIKESKLKEVFIIDHHELPISTDDIPEKIFMINPQLHDKEKISSSGLCYLFAKQLSQKPVDKSLAKLAVLGMIGDMMEKNMDKLNDTFIKDAEVVKKRGVLLYPSTRPLNRTLEFSSNPFIPGVSGDNEGAKELLKEAGLQFENGKTKCLIDLDEEEMSRLVTAIMLRRIKKTDNENIIGDIFLIKFFNKLEDARELSAMINACSRLGSSEIALLLCFENQKARKRAESLYAKYKQFIISGLKFAQSAKENKIEGNGYVILNAKSEIKDTIIGIIASILSKSSMYEGGTVIITMAYYEEGEKIKISSRVAGDEGKNVREILAKIIEQTGGEVGGHEFAAGAIIDKNKEEQFLKLLKNSLELEVVKV